MVPQRPALIIEVDEADEKEYDRVKLGSSGETKDLNKSYNVPIHRFMKERLGDKPRIAEYKKTRGDKFDALHSVQGFDKRDPKGRDFDELLEKESDKLQDTFLEYIQSLVFAMECLEAGSGIRNRQLRIKYTDRLELLAVLGPRVGSWK